MKQDEIEKAKRYALRLLGGRPYTKKELKDKLFKRGYRKRIVDEIEGDLKRLNLINDEQFALSYIETRLSRKPKGRRLLTQELQRKGINPEIIKKSLDKLLPKKKEFFLARRLAGKKIEKCQSLNKVPTKQRLYFYLRGRGFEEEIIEEVIEKIGTTDYDDE